MGDVMDLHDRPVSLDEFLELTEATDTALEFVGGEVRLVPTGGTYERAIVDRVARVMGDRCGIGNCRVVDRNLPLRRERGRDVRYYRPDVMVTCRAGSDDPYESDPCLIVEVMSPETVGRDLWDKRFAYEAIESVETYVVANSQSPTLLVFRRNASGEFFETKLGIDDRLVLDCPPTDIAVADLYRGVEFPAAP
jgi:Uma2 family endonuclease